MLQLYQDSRIGGQVRYVLTQNPRSIMRVPDLIKDCVGFVGYERAQGGEIAVVGSAFFIAKPIEGTGHSFQYAVTAKHVIDNIRHKGCDKVYLRLNFDDGEAHWVESPLAWWFYHEDINVDVAMFSIPEMDTVEFALIPTFTFATKEIIEQEGIGVGDEITIIGLFSPHYGTQRNIPIVRIGNIAAMPEEPVATKGFGLIEAYLIEARSIGGISGSPVFAHLGISRMINGKVEFQSGHPALYFLGLIHGHYDVPAAINNDENKPLTTERMNMGIGIVVPATKILEVFNEPMMKKELERREKDLRERLLPTPDLLEEGEEISAELRQGEFESMLKQVSRKTFVPEKEKKETSE